MLYPRLIYLPEHKEVQEALGGRGAVVATAEEWGWNRGSRGSRQRLNFCN